MLPSTKLRVLAASSDRFGALYYPYCLTSHALRSVLPLLAQGLLLVARLMPYQVGFPPTCYAILLLGALTSDFACQGIRLPAYQNTVSKNAI